MSADIPEEGNDSAIRIDQPDSNLRNSSSTNSKSLRSNSKQATAFRLLGFLFSAALTSLHGVRELRRKLI